MIYRIWLRLICAAFILVVFFQLAAAQDDPEKEYQLEQITVTAKKEESPTYEKSVIPEEEVSRPSVGGSVVDALKNQPWLHILYCRFFLKNLDQPEFFVSVLKEIPLKKQRDLDRLIKLGANPLAEMLGQDNEWSTSLK